MYAIGIAIRNIVCVCVVGGGEKKGGGFAAHDSTWYLKYPVYICTCCVLPCIAQCSENSCSTWGSKYNDG